jgi:F-type H+-transporting ATPase subunit delta
MNVLVESAIELTADQKKELQDILKKKLGTVTLKEKVNPSILGGLRVTAGSKRVDLSLKGKLDQVKKMLV